MKRFALIVLIAAVGCGKKAAPAPAVSEQVEATPATPTAAPRAARTVDRPDVPANAPKAVSFEDQLQGTVHPEMTLRLRMFEQMRGRLPQNFYELQNMPGFDSTPGLPPNMMYVIDPKDKTVKIVKK